MIVMPGAWRCERHRLWTNSDCPDCDLDLIAAHEERQDEDMTAPLTTRDALAAELAQHEARGASYYCSCATEPLTTSWEQHLADALLASDALTDATKLAADEALVQRVAHLHWGIPAGVEWADDAEVRNTRDMLDALAAALSAQSERAEVER